MNGRYYFATLARYHRWAYARLYEKVDQVSDADYHADLGLFFNSIHRTLNHLLLVDSLWQDRLRGVKTGKVNLAEEIQTDRQELKQEIFVQCERFIADVDATSEDSLDGETPFVNSQGEPHAFRRGPLLAHVINHATHHRGHVSAALTRLGMDAPVMDIPYFLIEQESRRPN